jgi:predicted CoA-binding protein
MTEAERILKAASSALVVDWPSRDVPDTLTRAGYAVFVKGGPEPDNYSAYEVSDGEVVTRRVGRAPERVDVVYSHRPLDELPGIVEMARELGATTVWCQSGLATSGENDPKGYWVPEEKSREARRMVESAGLAYVDDAYIADVARHLANPKG